MQYFSGTQKIEDRLQSLRLSKKPKVQDWVARFVLEPQFRRKDKPTKITIEGIEKLPQQGGCFIVMNHTDRYNYFPLQLELWRKRYPYTVTWVKAKYFENAAVAAFLEAANNIPVPSRNYILAKDFLAHFGRKPTREDFKELKTLAEGGTASARFTSLLARNWEGGTYAQSVELRLARMLAAVVAHTRDALMRGLMVIVFPEGTRSKQLGKGKPGIAQVLLSLGADFFPVGCNGSDLVFPGDLPWSQGGNIHYRVGERNRVATIPGLIPFSRAALKHQDEFELLIQSAMSQINALLDLPYQMAQKDFANTSSLDVDRFI